MFSERLPPLWTGHGISCSSSTGVPYPFPSHDPSLPPRRTRLRFPRWDPFSGVGLGSSPWKDLVLDLVERVEEPRPPRSRPPQPFEEGRNVGWWVSGGTWTLGVRTLDVTDGH